MINKGWGIVNKSKFIQFSIMSSLEKDTQRSAKKWMFDPRLWWTRRWRKEHWWCLEIGLPRLARFQASPAQVVSGCQNHIWINATRYWLPENNHKFCEMVIIIKYYELNCFHSEIEDVTVFWKKKQKKNIDVTENNL